MTRPPNRLRRFLNRNGSALILVMIMTTALAALAMSAIYMTSAGGLLLRYFGRERDYRYAAEAAIALGKSQVNRNTSLAIPEDTALQLMAGDSLRDASGAFIRNVKVNLYVGFTGDTVGRFGNYATLLAQSYDIGGTRMVRRVDLIAESFSRFAMFTNTFPAGLCYGTGEFISGRAHSNQRWNSCGSPGPLYSDTVTAVTTVNGTATYQRGFVAGAATIPYPTVAKLAVLPTYATQGNMNFTPVSGSAANALSGAKSMSGRLDTTTNAVRGTRLRFRPVDIDGDGSLAEADGALQIFDLASGIDTSALRVDLPRSTGTTQGWITYMNQCGILATISGRKEFFPMSRFREPWVVNRIRTLATVPTLTAADSTTMVAGTTAAYAKILSYPVGVSRCFPAGSPYLMLSERYVTNTAGTCTVTTSTAVTPAAWGAPATSCARYGGQDTTFTATPTRCWVTQTVFPGTGVCTGNQVALGSWRAWGGPALPAIPSSVLIQDVEEPYVWPLFKPYNLSAKGVIHATRGPLFISDTLRGNVTLYVLAGAGQGDIVLIDDTVYDTPPANALCRNFLGIIAEGDVMIADNALNRPRPAPGGTWRFLGTPHATLHMITMSLTGTVGVENYSGNQQAATAVTCTIVSSGGCINQAGGVIEQNITATYSGTGTGFQENRSVDPCQLTNRKPPFFPSTGRYLDNKYYEVDPNRVDSWAQVKAFYARLRG